MISRDDLLTYIDEGFATRLVMDLMAIPGRSGNEHDIATFVSQKLHEAGFPSDQILFDGAHSRSPIGGNCGNLVFHLPGTENAPRRMLMAHLDTVPICEHCEPVIEGERIVSANRRTALGGDDRAGVAVVLGTALTLLKHDLPRPPLTFFLCVQEEIGLVGAHYCDAELLLAPELCFNWDGGDPAMVTVGATGAYSMTIEIIGQASHAGVHPEQGISAVAIAGEAIAELVGNGWHGLIVRPEGTGTSNIGIIEGGSSTNVVMPHLKIVAECRSHDSEFRTEILKAYEQAFRNAASRITNDQGLRGEVRFVSELKYESFRLADENAAAARASQAIRNNGSQPRLHVGNGGLDANWMTAHGFPTVTLGCGQHDIHTVREWLSLPEYLTACRMALELATV